MSKLNKGYLYLLLHYKCGFLQLFFYLYTNLLKKFVKNRNIDNRIFSYLKLIKRQNEKIAPLFF